MKSHAGVATLHLSCTKMLCAPQISREKVLLEFDVKVKYAKDNLTSIKTRIATLNGFVAVVSDEHREMASQEEDIKKLLDQYFGHLQQVGFSTLLFSFSFNIWKQDGILGGYSDTRHTPVHDTKFSMRSSRCVWGEEGILGKLSF